MNDRSLLLEAGYGGAVYSNGSWNIGLEGLIWSELDALSEFRFPVLTADYFFGVYSLFHFCSADSSSPFRVRLSHISSHLVDGTPDTLIGGSSSHYSREFLTVEKLFDWNLLNRQVRFSAGVRYVFHQVTHAEPDFQIPATLQIGLLPKDTASITNIFLTLSSAGDPSGPSFSAALVFRSSFSQWNATDIFLSYLSGPEVEGNYATSTRNQVELGIRLLPK